MIKKVDWEKWFPISSQNMADTMVLSSNNQDDECCEINEVI